MLSKKLLVACLAIGMWAALETSASAGVVVGVRVGGGYYGRPCYGPGWGYGYGYYRPAVIIAAPPVVYAPAPVVYQQAPVVLQQAPVVVQPVPAVRATASEPPLHSQEVVTASAPAANNREEEINRHIQLLFHTDATTCAEAAMALGRLRAERAIVGIVSLLSSDPSPQVRESAARALGLIGTQRAMPALRNAAQSDADRDVRRSAQYTLELLTNQLR